MPPWSYHRNVGESAGEVLSREHERLNEAFDRIREEHADHVAAWHAAVKQMTTHVAVERTFLYPVVKKRHLGTSRLARELHHDYSRLEHLLVLTERRKINSPDMVELVTELLDVFEAHVQRCATGLIPAMDKGLSPAELQELGNRMTGAENVIVSHPHPHLLALGPVYPLTTRIASRWDRWRDRSVRNQ